MYLKTHLLLILLLGYCVTPLFSQNENDLKIRQPRPFVSEIEIFAGPSLSFLRGNPSVGNNSVITRSLKLGYTYGIGLMHPVNEKVGIKGLFLFESKGSIAKYDVQYFDETTQTFKLGKTKQEYIYDYYTVSLVGYYSTGKSGHFKIGAGPYVGYLKKQIVRTTHYPSNSVGIEDQTEYNKDLDFGCAIGISYNLPLNQRFSLRIQLLNTLGLANTRLRSYYANGTQKTNNMNLLLGISF